MPVEDYVRVIMDKTDVQDALHKFEELVNAELLATAAQVNTIARIGVSLGWLSVLKS